MTPAEPIGIEAQAVGQIHHADRSWGSVGALGDGLQGTLGPPPGPCLQATSGPGRPAPGHVEAEAQERHPIDCSAEGCSGSCWARSPGSLPGSRAATRTVTLVLPLPLIELGGRVLTRGVGVEGQDDALAEAGQQADVVLGQCVVTGRHGPAQADPGGRRSRWRSLGTRWLRRPRRWPPWPSSARRAPCSWHRSASRR